MSPENTTTPPSGTPPITWRRAGGLLVGPRGTMPPAFAVLLTVAILDVVLVLLVPFLLNRDSLNPWLVTDILAFRGFAVLCGLVFGTVAAVVADRANHTPWWFLAGQAGTFAAPVLASTEMVTQSPALASGIVAGLCAAGALATIFLLRGRAASTPPIQGPLTLGVCRFFHAAGNIWFGLTLLVLLVVALFWGTWWETWYGMKSVHHVFYTSWWFGLLFLTFAVSLVSATLRKYPWRLDQAGWIVIHSALVLIIVGSFMTYWGKKEGQIVLKEGQSASSFEVTTESRLAVHELFMNNGRIRSRPVWEIVPGFDVNPHDQWPDDRYVIEENGHKLFEVEVDRYLADAESFEIASNTGDRPRLAVEMALSAPGGGLAESFTLVEGDRQASRYDGPFFHALLGPPSSPKLLQALRGGRPGETRGNLVVTGPDGQTVLTVPLATGEEEPSDPKAPLALPLEVEIPGTGITVRGLGWYDYLVPGRTEGAPPSEGARGMAGNPAIEVELDGPEGKASRMAYALTDDPHAGHDHETLYEGYEVHLDHIPAYPLEEGVLFVLPHEEQPDRLDWVYILKSTKQRLHGEIVEGQPLALGIPMSLVAKKVYDRFHQVSGFKLKGYNPERQVAHVRVEGAEQLSETDGWMGLGSTRGIDLRTPDERTFRLTWVSARLPLDFELELRDFRRDFYPGSTQERTFESYLWLDPDLRDGDRTRRANVKIDMNHPLRFRGWRLYQSRFSMVEGETTILQVNRDPGLLLTYPALALLALGLIIAFFQKPFLRALARWFKRTGRESPTMTFVGAAASVALAALASVPGLLALMFLPEGPLMLLGMVLIVAGIFAETLIMTRIVAPRLEGKGAKSANRNRTLTGASA